MKHPNDPYPFKMSWYDKSKESWRQKRAAQKNEHYIGKEINLADHDETPDVSITLEILDTGESQALSVDDVLRMDNGLR